MLEFASARLQHLASYMVVIALVVYFTLIIHQSSSLSRGYLGAVVTAPSASVTGEGNLLVSPERLDDSRRLVAKGLQTTLTFLKYHLQQLAKSNPKAANQTSAILAEVGERLRVAQLDLKRFDQLGKLAVWREREARELSQLVQKRLHALQHPPDCRAAKKLACDLNRVMGLGSSIHQLVHCFMAAYESGRTMILQHRRWLYRREVWESLVQPVSVCDNLTHKTPAPTPWPGVAASDTVLFPLWRRPQPVPEPLHMPLSVPRDIADRLSRFHGHPGAWWAAQFLTYLMKLQPRMQDMIDQVHKTINFGHPIVGVHVRRSDKIIEAEYFDVEEYMTQVEDYYLALDLAAGSPVPRRVYLASEVDSIITEVKTKYPKYDILYHKRKTPMTAQSNMKDIIIDFHFLSRSDFLVCTFSSNVCRLAYEVMLTLHPDASLQVVSLDTPFFFHFMRPRRQRVRFHHHPNKSGVLKKKAMSVMAGQEVKVLRIYRQKHLKGYTMVEDANKDSWAYVPDFKLQDIVDVVNVTFPTTSSSSRSTAEGDD